MAEIKRYMGPITSDLQPEADGCWVTYKDHKALCDELRAALQHNPGEKEKQFCDCSFCWATGKFEKDHPAPASNGEDGSGLPTVQIQSSPGRSGPYVLAGDGARIVDIVDRVRAGDSVEATAHDFGIPTQQCQLLVEIAAAVSQGREEGEAGRRFPVSYAPAVDFSGIEGMEEMEEMVLAAACKLYEAKGKSGETPDDYMAVAEDALRAALRHQSGGSEVEGAGS